ncbi:MAG: Mur ligase domain-containing protein, partial [Defluviitaleaceae bacterium]|nr:Mur ligase domain-containing protein [Defluviitaleaceae bacterium]
MKLRDIFVDTKFTEIAGNTEITGICIDSRKVQPGNLYVCIEGIQVDGHSYVAEAVGKGAAAVLHKKGKRGMKDIDVPLVAAEDTRLALAFVCKRFFGDPTAGM